MKLLIFFFSTFFILSIQAEDIRKGTVQAETLRIRAKPSTKYEVVGQLNKGDVVKVVEEKEGWLKIIAPEVVSGWMSNKFITEGIVTGDKINVRAGPSVAFNIFGKLSKGDEVKVLEVKDKIWAKIQGNSKLHVWVSSTYIKLEPLIIARNDKENEKLNDVKAVDAGMDEKKAEELAKLQEELAKEKKIAEDAIRQLEEEKKKLAKLEEEKKATAQKVELIEKLLEIEKKKKSKKLVVNITKDDEFLIGSQKVNSDEIRDYYNAAGKGTIVFVKTEDNVKEATVLKIVNLFKELKAEVYLEDPSKLLDPDVSTLSKELWNTDPNQKTYMTLTVKKPNIMFMDTVKIPEEHLESILKTYGKNFNQSTVYIQSEQGVEEHILDRLMKNVQESGFKVITFPAGADGHEVVEEQPIEIKEDKEIPIPAGRIRKTGYLLNVQVNDRHIVDFALAIKVDKEFVAIAYLKGMADELKDYYLKEIEVIGVQKKLEGWTRPLIFVEKVKPLNK